MMDRYEAMIVEDFLGNNWSRFLSFLADREMLDEFEAETLGEEIIAALESA